ncbi:50S ribosomal protein L35 [Candidatus Peregrinibacteria bacterium]|nr:50S ribosomal protein L35 [Candidatus Peregrinibacteria bacterium]
MKQKSHSGMKKRIHFSSGGKAKFRKPCRNHLLFGKSKRQKRSFRKGVNADETNVSEIKRLLPNYL